MNKNRLSKPRYISNQRGRHFQLLRPASSESWIPLLGFDGEIKIYVFLQLMTRWGLIQVDGLRYIRFRRSMKGWPPFGLYIRLPFMYARWGAA